MFLPSEDNAISYIKSNFIKRHMATKSEDKEVTKVVTESIMYEDQTTLKDTTHTAKTYENNSTATEVKKDNFQSNQISLLDFIVECMSCFVVPIDRPSKDFNFFIRSIINAACEFSNGVNTRKGVVGTVAKLVGLPKLLIDSIVEIFLVMDNDTKQTPDLRLLKRSLKEELGIYNPVVAPILYGSLQVTVEVKSEHVFSEMIYHVLQDAGMSPELSKLVSTISLLSRTKGKENVRALMTEAIGLPDVICVPLIDLAQNSNQTMSSYDVIANLFEKISDVTGLDQSIVSVFMMPLYGLFDQNTRQNMISNMLKKSGIVHQGVDLFEEFVNLMIDVRDNMKQRNAFMVFGTALGTHLNIPTDISTAFIEAACATTEDDITDPLIRIGSLVAVSIGMSSDIIKNIILLVSTVNKKGDWKEPVLCIAGMIAEKAGIPMDVLQDIIDIAHDTIAQPVELDKHDALSNTKNIEGLLKLGGSIGSYCGVPEKLTTCLIKAIHKRFSHGNEHAAFRNLCNAIAMEVNRPSDIAEETVMLLITDKDTRAEAIKHLVNIICQHYKASDEVMVMLETTFNTILDKQKSEIDTICSMIDVCDKLAKQIGLPFDIIRTVIDVALGHYRGQNISDKIVDMNQSLALMLNYPKNVIDSILRLGNSVYKQTDSLQACMKFLDGISNYFYPNEDLVRKAVVVLFDLVKETNSVESMFELITQTINNSNMQSITSECVIEIADAIKDDKPEKLIPLLSKLAKQMQLPVPAKLVDKSFEAFISLSKHDNCDDVIVELMEMSAENVGLNKDVVKHVTKAAINISHGGNVDDILVDLGFNIGPHFGMDAESAKSMVKAACLTADN